MHEARGARERSHSGAAVRAQVAYGQAAPCPEPPRGPASLGADGQHGAPPSSGGTVASPDSRSAAGPSRTGRSSASAFQQYGGSLPRRGRGKP